MNETKETTADMLTPYHRFDEWTQRTGILDGGGLTWVVRLPLNLVFVLVLLLRAVVLWIIGKNSKEGKA